MRIPLLLALLLAPAAAGDLGRTLRALKGDREARREALEQLADGRIRPGTRAEEARVARGLKRFVTGRYPGTDRALAFRALGRLQRADVYDLLLDRLGRETDDRVLAAAEVVFSKAPERMTPAVLARLARAREPAQRAVLLRLLGVLPGTEAKRRIRLRARMSDHWCPRSAAVLALARDRDPAVFETLIELLDHPDPALLTAAIETLAHLSGKRFGRKIVAWKSWWNLEGRKAPLAEAAPERRRDRGKRVYAHEVKREPVAPYYFGIPIRGSKVAFVFDVSASMRTKLPLAYDQLSRAVKGLPSTTLFEVVFFNEFVWPWRSRLSRADPVTKELLVRHLPTIEIKSYTNLFDAIEKALSLDTDEVFVISDGEPNRGRRRLPGEILRELKRINTRRTRIHAISVVRVVDGGKHVALLERIAKDHGGVHVQRTLK